jgi:hypothetical protein
VQAHADRRDLDDLSRSRGRNFDHPGAFDLEPSVAQGAGDSNHATVDVVKTRTRELPCERGLDSVPAAGRARGV